MLLSFTYHEAIITAVHAGIMQMVTHEGRPFMQAFRKCLGTPPKV